MDLVDCNVREMGKFSVRSEFRVFIRGRGDVFRSRLLTSFKTLGTLMKESNATKVRVEV